MEFVQGFLTFGTLVYFLIFMTAVVLTSIMFRRVVPTNMVHIVQSRSKTIPYGTGQGSGNVYYQWPRWVPFFGITVIKLSVSNFDLSLKDYEAYDKDRVPFKVDVTAFFRIKNTAVAAQRVSSTEELREQLLLIVQGAVRKVLASDIIDSIMLERSKFGDAFTQEVSEQLQEWGVESVKSMELMDIRDAHESRVITNIMAKKTSHIEMESRTEVANNMKKAQTAEIEAKQVVDVRQQEADEVVGKRTAEKDKMVGIAKELSRQDVLAQEKVTKERDMDVKKVQEVNLAQIIKEKEIVVAEQDKKTRVIVAEGEREAKEQEAIGIRVVGEAKADAEKAMQLAPVQAQITLAKEIGENAGYQNYLAIIESVKAYIEVGSKQAEALQKADVKVIANTGHPTDGMTSAMDLFTPEGGTKIAAMIEAFGQTPLGKVALDAFLKNKGNSEIKPTEMKEVDGEAS